MKSTLSFAVVAVLASGALAQSTMTINTPSSLVQCQPQLLQWSGGTPPYFLSVEPGNQPGAAALEDLGQQDGTSLTWLVNIAQGTSVGFLLRDSTGATAQSAAVTIQNSSSSSCVGQAATSGGAGGSAATTGSGTTGGATTGTSPVTSAPSTTGGSSSSTTPRSSGASSSGSRSSSGSSTGTGAPASTTSNAASPNAQFGIVGAVGAAVLALLS